MGGLEFPGLAQFLGQLGIAGAIIGYLLYERAGLQKKLEEANAAHMADIKKYSADIASSLATSTQVLQANTAAQDKAAASAGLISQALQVLSLKLEGLESAIERLESRGVRS